jgi:tetratricopeptide (TPR) repeat protein
MKLAYKVWFGTAVILGFSAVSSGVAFAQAPASSQGQSAPPTAADKDKLPPTASSLSLDLPATAPANAEEDAAYKAFSDVPQTDPKKKTDLGEAFLQKYPNSRYLPPVYSGMTMAYMMTNEIQKMEEIGDKEIALTPNDVQTMAILGQTIPRVVHSNTPNAGQELAKAEKYDKMAIEITPTISKPENVTQAQFEAAKNVTLAMAHSGLGLINLLHGKYTEAIPELETSLKIDPTPDLVNFYLLGRANEKASHFDDAIAAYTKCATAGSPMEAACKSGVEQAKKAASTQLSAPK